MTSERSPTGCVWSMLGVNAVIIGLLTLSYTQGPYSSWEQELWYRYGSLAFLSGGVILPAIAMLLGASRSRKMMGLLVALMAQRSLRSSTGQ